MATANDRLVARHHIRRDPPSHRLMHPSNDSWTHVGCGTTASCFYVLFITIQHAMTILVVRVGEIAGNVAIAVRGGGGLGHQAVDGASVTFQYLLFASNAE